MLVTRSNETSNRILLTTLTIGHMINDFYGLVLPFLLPTLMLVFDMNFASAGLLAFASGILGSVLQPVSGFIGDRFGQRKRIIIFGFIAITIGLLLVATSISYGMILLAWLIYGFGMATFHPQSTNLITRAYAAAKGRAMGIHGIGGAIGNFTAPLIIAFLVTLVDWRYTAVLLMIPSVVAIALVSLFLKEPARETHNMPRVHIAPSLWLLALTFGLIYMMYRGFLTFLPTYLVEQGSSLNQAGFIASLMLLVGFIAQPAGGIIYDRIGGRWLLTLSALLAGSALLIFVGDNAIPHLIPIAILGAAVTATFPVSLAMASDIAGKEGAGLSVGIVFGVSSLLSAVTPAFTGYLADAIGLRLALQWLVVFPLAALAVTFFLPKKL